MSQIIFPYISYHSILLTLFLPMIYICSHIYFYDPNKLLVINIAIKITSTHPKIECPRTPNSTKQTITNSRDPLLHCYTHQIVHSPGHMSRALVTLRPGSRDRIRCSVSLCVVPPCSAVNHSGYQTLAEFCKTKWGLAECGCGAFRLRFSALFNNARNVCIYRELILQNCQ